MAHLSGCILLLSFFFLACLRHRKDDHRTRASLQALMTVIVPTCSLWSTRYTKLASVSRSRISIPLESIIDDFLEGIIELRNPMDDLANLIGPGITAHGRIISISIGWKWWINALRWWTVIKHKPDSLIQEPLAFSPFMSPLVSSSPDSGPSICLDYQLPGFIPSLIPGCKHALEFTALSPSFRSLSTAHVMSTIPFILSSSSARYPRSPASVLEQLAAPNGPSLVVNTLSNISVDYESALRKLFDSVSEDQKTRDIMIKTLGLKAWRRGVFLVALEAVLVRRGWLERWVVQVNAK